MENISISSQFDIFHSPINFSLKNDLMFHVVMQKSPKALTSLVCALKNLSPGAVRSVCLRNPIIFGSYDESKEVILDVLVEMNDSEYINLELQIYVDKYWIMRSLLYLARTFDSLRIGQKYKDLKPTTIVCIMGYMLFPEDPEFYARYELKNTRNNRSYTSNFNLNVLDLSRLDLATRKDVSCGLADWARIFNAATWEELYALSKDNEVFMEVYEIMRAAELSPEERTMLEGHRRWLEVHNTLMGDLEDARAELSSTQSRLKTTETALSSTQVKLSSTEAELAAERRLTEELRRQIRELTSN